jgi:hypothetical protein
VRRYLRIVSTVAYLDLARREADLGLVFACAAPSTTYEAPPGAPLLYGDVLSVRMNDNIADIMAWITAHPSAVTSCGVAILYGNSGHTPQAISFLWNGVRFDRTAGVDGQVVSSVTLFDPQRDRPSYQPVTVGLPSKERRCACSTPSSQSPGSLSAAAAPPRPLPTRRQTL